MAKMLGMEVADPVPFSLVTYMADKRPVWERPAKLVNPTDGRIFVPKPDLTG
jgi:hypothetical protein